MRHGFLQVCYTTSFRGSQHTFYYRLLLTPLSLAWHRENPNIDGKGPDTKFCVFKNGHLTDYSQASFSDLIGLFSIGLSGKEPVTLPATVKVTTTHVVEAAYPRESGQRYPSHQVRVGRITLALCNEWAAQKVIKDQWKVLEKAKPYLQEVKKTQDACIKPLEDLIARKFSIMKF
jgi:hypothetical protein